MKSSLRKLLSFLLALIMCISLLPVSAFAEEIEEQAGEEEPAAANPVVGPGETGGECEDSDAESENPADESDNPAGEEEKAADEAENADEESEEEVPAEAEPAGDEADVSAQSILDSGPCGDNLIWTLEVDSDKVHTLTISGTGDMYDYTGSSYAAGAAPWISYIVDVVIIKPGVTSVGDNAFDGLGMTSVTIGNDVTHIGENAFHGGYFTYITIPDSVTTIERLAFFGCNYLVTVTVPGSVTSMGDRVFYCCQGLQSATLAEGISTIPEGMFQNAFCLETVTIPSTVTSVGEKAFNNTSLTDVYYNGTSAQWSALLSSVGADNDKLTGAAVHCAPSGTCGTDLTWILYLDGTLRISGSGTMNDYAAAGTGVSPWYSEKYSVHSVVIDPGVTYIGENAFAECLLYDVVIPEGVTAVGDDAFKFCSMLGNVTYAGTLAEWNAISFGANNNYLTGAELHCDLARGNCGSGLTWALTSDYNLIISGSGAMNDYNNNYSPAPWVAYREDIRSVSLPEGLTAIGTDAFCVCSGIASVSVPDSVTEIGSRAFVECSGLESLYLGAGVNSVSHEAFRNCGGLSSVNVSSGNTAYRSDGNCVIETSSNTLVIGTNSTVIPSGVTKIGIYAFSERSGLTEISFPASVSEIAMYSFYGCDGLSSLSVPGTVKSIGDFAFAYCGLLSSLTISEGVESIGDSAFMECNSLQSVTVPGSVTAIGNGAFCGCENLSSAIIEEGVESIGEYSFGWCSALSHITVPRSVTAIEDGAFKSAGVSVVYYSGTAADWAAVTIGSDNGCLSEATVHCSIDYGTCGTNLSWTLTEDYTLVISGTGAMTDYYPVSPAPWYSYREDILNITISGGVGTLGNYAFYNFTKLTSATVPDNITRIGGGAFASCSALESVCLGAGVDAINSSAFWDCGSLMSVTVAPGNTSFKSEGNCVIKIKGGASDLVIGTGSSVIPSWVTKIGYGAFRGRDALTEIVIPTNITAIDGCAFYECYGLTSISIPGSVESIGDSAFTNCRNLSSLTLCDGIKNIGPLAFASTDIDTLTMGEGVETIGSKAFSQCNKLKTVTIPHTLTNINEEAFELCPNIEDVYYRGTSDEWDTVVIGADNECLTDAEIHFSIARGTCAPGVSWFLTDTGTLEITGAGAIPDYDTENRAPWHDELWSEVKSVVIHSGIERIGNYAFENLRNLKTVSIPETVTYIGVDAFAKCALESVTIPDSVTVIKRAAFYSCKSLVNVDLGSGITSIPFSIFNGCSSLETVNIHSGVTFIDYIAFAGTAIKAITIPDGVTSIAGMVFNYCEQLTTVTLPDSITQINTTTFSECYNLRDVYFCGTRAQWDNIVAAADGAVLQGLENATVHCFEDFGALTLSHDYLLLKTGETAQLTMTVNPASMADRLTWTIDDPTVASVDASGLVTAGGAKGTAYITASITVNGASLAVRCRVDVTEPGAADNPRNVTGVQLITTSGTANVYKNASYTAISVLPILDQNLEEAGALSLAPEENDGVSLEAARFASDAVAKYFDLRVKDDRTLEIIPTAEAIAAAQSGSKSLKGTYSSAIVVKIEGCEQLFTTGTFKLTVKKTLPSIKASKIAFNSYSTRVGDFYALKLTGGTVTAVEPDTAAAAKEKKSAVPDWMVLDTSGFNVSLSTLVIPSKYPASGTIYLKATVEGWAVPVSVKASFTVKKTAPKLTFAAKSVTLLQSGTDATKLSVRTSPAIFGSPYVSRVEVLKGKTYVPIGGSGELQAYIALYGSEYELVLRAPNISADGKAHTYRVVLNCDGKEFTFPVKTLAASVKPTVTTKASGGINTKVADSPFSITFTPKNFHAGLGETYSLERIERYKGTKLADFDVQSLFNVTQSGAAFTFREKSAGSLIKGSTYKAVIGVDINGDGVADNTVTVPLKITFATKTPSVSVSVKKAGTLDVTRRGNMITLTPSVSNLYGSMVYDIEFYKKSGSKYILLDTPEELAGIPFEFSERWDGVYTLTLKDTCSAATSAYYVRIGARLTTDTVWHWSKNVSVPVTQGKVTVKSSATSVALLKKDRFSRALITFTIADETVSAISDVRLDATSAKEYQIVPLGGGTYALEYKDHTRPASFKAAAVKLTVYVDGCTASVATKSVKLSFK